MIDPIYKELCDFYHLKIVFLKREIKILHRSFKDVSSEEGRKRLNEAISSLRKELEDSEKEYQKYSKLV